MRAHARDGMRNPPPSGYTLIELVVVLMIAALLLGYGVQALNKASADRAATGARDTFVWLARRARALAVQRGTNVTLTIKPATSRAKVLLAGTIVDQVYFNQQFGATPTLSSGDSLAICYTPRGIAQTTTPCSTLSSPITVTFQQGGRNARAVVQALGQVEAQ